jgi:hypothetical protein
MFERRVAAFLFVIAAGSAFVIGQQETFRGRWHIDAQAWVLVFEPCGVQERWLIEVDSSLREQSLAETTMVFVAGLPDSAPSDLTSLVPIPPAIFVIVKGDTSSRGAYGPKGQFSRRLLVRTVDTLSETESARCL